MWTLRHLEPLN